MVRERARIAESDDAATSREKLRAMLGEYVTDAGERAWMEPRLAALLGLEAAPPGEREEFEAACRTLFDRISERGTVVLVFEELQWADPALLDFIETITDRSRARPILAVTLSRPDLLERRPTWGAGLRSFSNLPLDPLAPDEVQMLLVGSCPGTPGIRHRGDRRALGGDPALRGGDGPDAPGPGCPARARRPLPPRRRARAAGDPRDDDRPAWLAPRRPDGAGADAGRPRCGARPFVHGPGAGGGDRALPGPSRVHARRARPQGDLRSRAGPALTRTGPVPLRPGAHPRGRLRAAGEARPAGPPPRGGAPLRGARRSRSWRASSPRTTSRPIASRPRGRNAWRSRPRPGRR